MVEVKYGERIRATVISELKFEAPPELVSLLQELGEPTSMVKECIVLELYRRGVISSGKAAELLGMGRFEFIRYSGRLGIPYFRCPPFISGSRLVYLRVDQLGQWNQCY